MTSSSIMCLQMATADLSGDKTFLLTLDATCVRLSLQPLSSDCFHFRDKEMVYESCGPSLTPWGIVPHYLRSCLHSTA